MLIIQMVMPSTSVSPKTAAFTACSALGSVTSENEHLHQSFWHTCCWVDSDFGVWVFVCLCILYFEIEQLHQINQYDTLCHWHRSYCWSDKGWHGKSVIWDLAILINNKKTSQRATNFNTFIPLLWPRLMIQSLADDSIWSILAFAGMKSILPCGVPMNPH